MYVHHWGDCSALWFLLQQVYLHVIKNIQSHTYKTRVVNTMRDVCAVMLLVTYYSTVSCCSFPWTANSYLQERCTRITIQTTWLQLHMHVILYN